MIKKTLLDIIKDEEEKYLFSKYSTIKSSKQKGIDQLIQRIKLQQSFGNQGHHTLIMNQLREISISKGGFLSNENRLVIYEYILNILHPEEVQLASHDWDIVEQNADIIMNDSQRAAYEKPPQDWGIVDRSSDIIMNDCKRSVILKMLSDNKWPIDSRDKSTVQFINDLNAFIVSAITQVREFKYYQGYHELALYFLLLFGKEKGVNLLRKFTMQFVYCYVDRDDREGLTYEKVVELLSAKVIKRNGNMKDVIRQLLLMPTYFALPWVSTWFTHNNSCLFQQFRLIDYFICSKKDSILSLASIILADEYNELKAMNKKEEIDIKELYEHYNRLRIESLDVEGLVNETERITRLNSQGDEKKMERDIFFSADDRRTDTVTATATELKKGNSKRGDDDIEKQNESKMIYIMMMIFGIVISLFIDLCDRYN